MITSPPRHQGVFSDIYVSFLIKGHTHFDPDQVFSRVATQLKVEDALCPSQFEDVLTKVFCFFCNIIFL